MSRCAASEALFLRPSARVSVLLSESRDCDEEDEMTSSTNEYQRQAADPSANQSAAAPTPCCGAAEQATCCEPSAKQSCCGMPEASQQPAPGTCGCR